MTGETIKSRFESKVRQSDSCWEWLAAKTWQGYGQFGFRGQMRGAHRVSYILYIGEIPKGLHVLHSCDNPSCVNPKHLSLGTNTDNVKQRTERGRGYIPPTGEEHPNSTLTNSERAEIRRLYLTGEFSQRELAFRFSCTKSTIAAILKRGEAECTRPTTTLVLA